METVARRTDIEVGKLVSLSARDRLFKHLPDIPPASGGRGDRKLNWGDTLDLIEEVATAFAASEARAKEADEYSQRLEAFHKEQLATANDRIAAAERKADEAVQKLAEAETWLSKIHERLFGHFQEVSHQAEAR